MGEIRSKRCERRELTKDQLAGECRNAWSPSCDMDSLLEEIPAGQMATLFVVLILGL